MERINIMTWNTGMTEWNNNVDNSKRYKEIVNHINEHLKKVNSIVFLQQIPYKIKENSTWREHPLFNMLQKDFSNYDILYNTYNKGYVIMMTIVIAAKNSAVPAKKEIYPNNTPTNRECAVMYSGLNILGVHAKNGEGNKRYLEDINGQADIILGDFNAGNYMMSENKFTFSCILKGHVNICNMPTRVDPQSGRRTCIDHIFVRENLVIRCSNMIVHEDIKLSDHFPLTFEMDI